MSRDPLSAKSLNPNTLLSSSDFAAVFRDWKELIRSAVSTPEAWALVGIKRRGAVLARRLWEQLRPVQPPPVPSMGGTESNWEYGEVDISLYRDDYHLQLSQPRVLGTEIPFNVEGRRILLVDDVLYTGRTVRAAIDQILDFGRPKAIQLGVFIDRGHRELPIAADFIGKKISTQAKDRVQVWLQEIDGEDKVLLCKV